MTPIPPVPGGGGTGGEVRKERETATIKGRAKSTSLCPSVLTFVLVLPPTVHAHLQQRACTHPFTAVHVLLPEETQQSKHTAAKLHRGYVTAAMTSPLSSYRMSLVCRLEHLVLTDFTLISPFESAFC